MDASCPHPQCSDGWLEPPDANDPVGQPCPICAGNWNKGGITFQACGTCARLRGALAQLVGSDDLHELTAMEIAMREIPAPEEDKAASMNAIRVLIETAAPDEAPPKCPDVEYRRELNGGFG